MDFEAMDFEPMDFEPMDFEPMDFLKQWMLVCPIWLPLFLLFSLFVCNS